MLYKIYSYKKKDCYPAIFPFYFHSIFIKATHFQYFYIKFSIAIFIYFLELFIY